MKFPLYSEEYLEFLGYLKNIGYLFHYFCTEHQKVLTKFFHPNLLEIYSILPLLLIYTAAVTVKVVCKCCSRFFGCDSHPCPCCIKTVLKIINLSVIL
jgi:hypothetical protein